MVLPRYYKLEGNEDKTPKDLELELQKRNFNFGLINEKDSDPDVEKYDNGEIKFVKSKYIFGKHKIKLDKVEDHHIAKYNVIISSSKRICN